MRCCCHLCRNHFSCLWEIWRDVSQAHQSFGDEAFEHLRWKAQLTYFLVCLYTIVSVKCIRQKCLSVFTLTYLNTRTYFDLSIIQSHRKR